MDVKKLKVGKRVMYSSRKNAGLGKVTEIYAGETGDWVKVEDKVRGVTVTVRPSQVSAT